VKQLSVFFDKTSFHRLIFTRDST